MRLSFYNILDLLDPEFEEIDGGYYVKGAYHVNYATARKSLIAKEWLANHNHIADGSYTYIEDETTGLAAENQSWDDRFDEQVWRFGCAVIRAWAIKLSEVFPGVRFRLYCYRSGDDEWGLVIGFHKVREGEANWIEHSAEDVYIIDTGKTLSGSST